MMTWGLWVGRQWCGLRGNFQREILAAWRMSENLRGLGFSKAAWRLTSSARCYYDPYIYSAIVK
jgi:hypothetical protein